NQVTLTTQLSATSVTVGATVHDSATLAGASADAGGTVTYTVYTNNTCTAGAQSAGTAAVVNGQAADSNDVTFNTAGTFFWQAAYSGDAKNSAATSVCTSEQLVVNPKAAVTVTTQLSAASIIVGGKAHDSATLTGATADAGGT